MCATTGELPISVVTTLRKERSSMLMRTDPFRELDRLTQQLFGQNGTWSRPAVMPMDAYRDGEQFVVHFDLPGVDASSVDLNVERNVLTVKAERVPSYGDDVELQVAERPRGVFSRQLFLGDTLNLDQIEASYDAGVLTLRIPIAEKAKPRKIEITGGGAPKQINA
jgi:HSP20 family protein